MTTTNTYHSPLPGSLTPCRCMLVGTDTGVGKTWTVIRLIQGLRARARRVWIHKPVACGDWQDGQAEDVRLLSPWLGDGQAAASLCCGQWPLAAAPHRAAAAAGARLHLADLEAGLRPLMTGDHDLLVEGAGGLLSPLVYASAQGPQLGTAADLAERLDLPLLLVSSNRLGMMHQCAATCAAARARGLHLLGLVVNAVERPVSGPAGDGLAAEAAAHAGLSLLGELAHAETGEAPELAQALLHAIGSR